ncbi:MAG: phosphoribosylaminoimidazolesuccinocarboxamide synthase [Bacteroidota bacterium]
MAISATSFEFPFQTSQYQGKVRDTYNIGEELLVIVASDRISAFDHILPRPIPYKGQVLNQTAAYFFEAVKDIVPTHVVSVPDPNVTIGRACKPIPIEVVVRGYLAGHAWREYKSGKRQVCEVPLPEGLTEADKLPEPIITPATKSQIGHDMDISEREILRSGLLEPEEWAKLKHYALALFQKGTEMAEERGLILVDTKYEFGYYKDDIYLIDEVHTPDSSRFYYADGYEERQAKGEQQRQLSKEFVREWLMENGFQGLDGQVMPEMPDTFVQQVSDRYIELYETVTGRKFEKDGIEDPRQRIEQHVLQALAELTNAK